MLRAKPLPLPALHRVLLSVSISLTVTPNVHHFVTILQTPIILCVQLARRPLDLTNVRVINLLARESAQLPVALR